MASNSKIVNVEMHTDVHGGQVSVTLWVVRVTNGVRVVNYWILTDNTDLSRYNRMLLLLGLHLVRKSKNNDVVMGYNSHNG